VWTPISSAVTINVRLLMFLIDTNVISEARKGLRADEGVHDFCAIAARDNTPLFLAAITIGELRRGVELIRHRGDHRQAQMLEQWLAEVLQTYGDRVLNLDGDAAQIWGDCRCPIPTTPSTSRSPPSPCCTISLLLRTTSMSSPAAECGC